MYFQTSLIAAIEDADPSYLALSVMAHEVKHVTSLYNTVARERNLAGNAFHDLWVEEGTAEISQTMSSRIAWAAIGGPAVGEPVTGDALIKTYHEPGSSIAEEYRALRIKLTAECNDGRICVLITSSDPR